MRLRIAPSPTGNLHIGTLRTTLFNWILAQKTGGTLILRIEDTDLERSQQVFETNIFEGIHWMGLDPHEGPVQGGPHTPYRQSERMKLGVYSQKAQELLAQGKAYCCFCSDAELDQEREAAVAANRPYVYSRKCVALTPEEVAAKKQAGIPHTIRFRIPEGSPVVFEDLIRETIQFDRQLLSDFVMMKSDGSPSYNFAVVIDDLAMAITHVVRGEDHISNTPRQLLLFEAFGQTPPRYAHLPMILGPDRSKLSKRHGATSVNEYRDAGYLPEAMFNYLVLLGWSSPSGKEVMSKKDIIEEFTLERISKSGAIFDLTKLRWMNGQYIRQLDKDALYHRLIPFVAEELRPQVDALDPASLKRMFFSLRDNLDVLVDINVHLPVYLYTFEDYKKYVESLVFTELDVTVLQTFLKRCESLEFHTPNIEALLNEIVTELKVGKGKVLKPIRLATSGQGSGPHLPEFLSILGKEMIQKRLGYVLSRV